MSITLQPATPDSLGELVEAVAVWQHDGGPVQLHPGDLGWNRSLDGQDLAEAVLATYVSAGFQKLPDVTDLRRTN